MTENFHRNGNILLSGVDLVSKVRRNEAAACSRGGHRELSKANWPRHNGLFAHRRVQKLSRSIQEEKSGRKKVQAAATYFISSLLHDELAVSRLARFCRAQGKAL